MSTHSVFNISLKAGLILLTPSNIRTVVSPTVHDIDCVCRSDSVLEVVASFGGDLLFESKGAVPGPQIRTQLTTSSATDSTSFLHVLSIGVSIETLADNIAEFEYLIGHLLGTDLLRVQHLECLSLLLGHLGPVLNSYFALTWERSGSSLHRSILLRDN